MDIGKPPYFSGKKTQPIMVLDRFLPPYPTESLIDMLHYIGIEDGWVLDPIGNQPLSAIELAQAGFKVLVTCNNPIVSRIMQVLCYGYQKSQFQAAIADLGALKRGEERLESQIKNLYLSPCPECSSYSTKVKYLWKKNQDLPFAREILCEDCGATCVFKISEVDEKNLSQLGNIRLHKTRLLQRVLPGNENPPIAIKEVVDSYLPRSISVISSLVNKLESIDFSDDRKAIIEAILIQVFDYGNMLWSLSTTRSRPKQISIPSEFYEFNLWEVIENSISNLMILEKPIPFVNYPDLPPDSGGITFYPGRIHSLPDNFQRPDFSAIATVLPRPNQAMWTYNAVWSGWLWGNQAARKLKGALERRRYDWVWHAQAIRKVFEHTSQYSVPIVAIAPELTNSYILAYLTAASSSNFSLVNAAYHPETKISQFYWMPTKKHTSTENEVSNLKKYLQLKSEPADYQELLSVFFLSETIDNNEDLSLNSFDNSLFMNAQALFDRQLMDKDEFTQVDDTQLENGEFWLTKEPPIYVPVSDKIEKEFIRFIQSNDSFSMEETAYTINQNLPGLIPASQYHLQRLFASYCVSNPEKPGIWSRKPNESINLRKQDILELRKIVYFIGNKLGYEVVGENPIIWNSSEQINNFQFFITASSIISQFQTKIDPDISEVVIIFPGSRSDLISYKIKNDPIYKQHFGKYHYVKFRHIRRIYENPDLDHKTWGKLLDNDPAVFQETNQPVLF